MASKKETVLMYSLIAVTAMLITAFVWYFRQNVFLTIPLYISLIVMLLQSRVSRPAFLLGGLNSLLYGACYAFNGLYASAAYAVFVSFPLQIATFVNWKKRAADTGVTSFKRLGPKKGLLLFLFCALAWGVMCAVFSALHAKFVLWDNATTVLGIATTVLCMLAYIEYVPLQLFGLVSSTVTYVLVMRENPIQITYIVFNLYATVCALLALVKINRLYKSQKEAEV